MSPMRPPVVLIITIIITFNTTVFAASPETDSQFQHLYGHAAELKYSGEYHAAIRVAEEITRMYPDNPAGHLALLAAYRTLMDDLRIQTYRSRMDSLIHVSLKLAENHVKQDKKDARAYFYLATSHASRALSRARKGELLGAVKDGFMVNRSYRRSIAYNPELYDAYYGLGQFCYWSTVFSKVGRLVNDQRDEGIAYLKLAAEKGRYLRTDALFGLLAIYYHEQKYQGAMRISEKLLLRYPQNPGLLYKAGRIAQQLENWQGAAIEFAKLYDILLDTKHQSQAFQMDCLLQRAKCSLQRGDFQDAKRFSGQSVEIANRIDLSKESYNYSGFDDELRYLIKQLEDIEQDQKLLVIQDTEYGMHDIDN